MLCHSLFNECFIGLLHILVLHVPDNQNMIMKLKRENFIFIQCFISTFGCVMYNIYIKVCIDINFFLSLHKNTSFKDGKKSY